MYETFLSNIRIFNNDINFIIESNDKAKILRILKEQHLIEIENNLAVSIKRNDLIIWNAIYTREVIKTGVTKNSLHSIYNKYYEKIEAAADLLEMQEIELKMVSSYFDILINDVEVTDNFMINKMLQYIHMNIENHITLKKLCTDLNISMGYASDCFKKNMGIPVMRYAKKVKIERAKTLLLSTDDSILDIGFLLGFFDESHFSRTFKALVGVSPTEYRNQNYS